MKVQWEAICRNVLGFAALVLAWAAISHRDYIALLAACAMVAVMFAPPESKIALSGEKRFAVYRALGIIFFPTASVETRAP